MATKTRAVEVEEAPAVETVKCDNHPDREGVTYSPGNAVKVNLCDECAPPWFKD